VQLYADVEIYQTPMMARFDDAFLGGSINYFAEDFLGTSRVATDASGVVCYDADFYPYGGEVPYTNSCSPVFKFEGKERDTESGNDYFGGRYYSNRYARWLSADWSAVPVAVPYANLSNPQTLNLYSMVADDPESFADLDGHCWKWLQGVCNVLEYGHWVDNDHLQAALQADADRAAAIREEHQRFVAQWNKEHPGRDFEAESAMWLSIYGAGMGYVGGQIEPEVPPEINWGQQEKHFEGHNSYGEGRSTLTANPEELAGKAGTGQPVNNVPRGQPGFKERVDFGKVIGNFVDQKTGASTPTTKGIIHYSNNGIHIVPARP
jgi:RHS repeat-associated protein